MRQIGFLLAFLVVAASGLVSYRTSKAFFSDPASSISNTFAASTSFPTPTPSAPSVVISEIQIRGSDSGHDFIELYNLTDSPIDLSGWQVKKRNVEGEESTLVSISAGTIPAHGYFLWGSLQDDYHTTIDADVQSDNNIGINNSLALVRPDSGIADQVAWGSSTNPFIEDTAVSVAFNTANQSIERKALEGSDSSSMSGGADQDHGNGHDSNHNFNDFVLRTSAQPQNSSSPPEDPSDPPAPATIADHIVISEIQIAGTDTTNDFIELYNPTESAVSLSGWKLKKRNSAGNDGAIITFGSGATIPSHGYFLWANTTDGFHTSISADDGTTATVSPDNSIALTTPGETIVDQVAWGSAPNSFVEGSAIASNPPANQSLERKAQSSSDVTSMTSGSDVSKGNGHDTENNSTDFILRTTTQPQNSTTGGTEMP